MQNTSNQSSPKPTEKRKVFYILSFLISLGVFSSCSDFLDEKLQGQYTDATYFQTEDHAMNAVTATYELTSFKSSANALWVFGDVASDDAIKGGNPGDQSEIEYIDQFQTNADNGFVETIWKHYYEGISRANNCIAKIPLIEMDETQQEQLVGEALFLRAYYYFHLLNIFGEIPLKTEPAVTSDELHVAKASTDAIWEQIKSDLRSSADQLAIQASNPGRATKGAALGLLAKSHLFCNEWQDALDVIAEMEQLNSYSLMPVYAQNFRVEFENNNESIFEIQHLAGQIPNQGNLLNQWFAPQIENGYFFNVPTQNLVDEFEKNNEGIVDPRLDYTIGREGQTWINGEAFDPAWSPTGFLGKKQLQPLTEVAKGVKGDGDLNYTFMRWSEILLIKAEALNESGNTAEALVPLNKVRTRARESYIYDLNLGGGNEVPQGLLPVRTTNDQSVLRDLIRHERRVELAFEFHRYYDLMRYGKEVAEKALSDNHFSYEEHRYFPIPQSEMDTNKNLNK